MKIEVIKGLLKNIIYPNLDRDIVSLELIKDIKIKNKTLRIEVLSSNEDIFHSIEEQIKMLFKDDFEEIEVRFLTTKQNSINYGNTQTPNNRAPYAKHIIAVTSGKGGVGKSTVSVNLAVSLAQIGFSVGLLDADVYGPNIPRMLGIAQEKLQWSKDDKMIPSENYGIKVMSVGLTTPSSDTPLVWRSSVAVSALIQFLEDVAWGELDFLIIDMPPGTGDIQLTMAQELPITSSVIVTTPQLISCDDVSRAIMMFKDIKVPIGGIVENMSTFMAPDTKKEYAIFGSGGAQNLCDTYDIKLLGKIPLTMDIRETSDSGRPAVATDNAIQKGYYREITKNLLLEMGLL
ncbi:MAG: Mrp/NBP35 family ATP-binding protein [Campylobacterales bacterium]|nr:Mrp/NBP35 family ATP-binding protein [Campylobacterales bacterium]